MDTAMRIECASNPISAFTWIRIGIRCTPNAHCIQSTSGGDLEADWNWIICERIWEKGPLGTNFHLEIWSKISNQPQSGLFPDYCSSTNYYPLPTFWHKSDARACCCSSMQSVYLHPLNPPFIAWTGGVVTWAQCYRGNRGSSTSV